MRRPLLVFVLMVLAGCAVNPLPEGYRGPIAFVLDSVANDMGNRAEFFYLSTVNGQKIEDSAMVTEQRNYNRGMAMTPHVIGRYVPAQKSRVGLEGHTQFAAPILALVNRGYSVSGEVEFDPQPDVKYVVKGVLGDAYSGVWIEELATGRVVTQKVESRP